MTINLRDDSGEIAKEAMVIPSLILRHAKVILAQAKRPSMGSGGLTMYQCPVFAVLKIGDTFLLARYVFFA